MKKYVLPVSELNALLNDPGSENIEQSNLCVKGKETTICCMLI